MLELLIVLGAGAVAWALYQRGQGAAPTPQTQVPQLPTFTGLTTDFGGATTPSTGTAPANPLDEWSRRLGLGSWDQPITGTYQAPPVGSWDSWGNSGGGGGGGGWNWSGDSGFSGGGQTAAPPVNTGTPLPGAGGQQPSDGEDLLRSYVSPDGSGITGWYTNNDTILLRAAARTDGSAAPPDFNVPPGNTIIALKAREGSEYFIVAMMPRSPSGFFLYYGKADLGRPGRLVTMQGTTTSRFVPSSNTQSSVLHGRGESSSFEPDVSLPAGRAAWVMPDMLLGPQVGMNLATLAAPPPARTGQAYHPHFAVILNSPYDRLSVVWATANEITAPG